MSKAVLQERLARWIAAETEVLERGQSAAIHGRMLTRGSLTEIRSAIKDLERQIANCDRRGMRTWKGVPKW
jgi:hypothetical protein